MGKILDGYQNEFLFVLEFNNKRIKDLNPLLREVVDDLFPGYNEESIIKSWRNHINNEKGDIMIKVNGHIRSISIKKGSRNSVHVESLKNFKEYLSKCGISPNAINEYVLFHYGKDVNDYSNILSSEEYVSQNEKAIALINRDFSKLDIDSIIRRFILKGNTNSLYEVSGIIYGTPNDFFWINKSQIKEIITDSLMREAKSVHYGCLYIQPLDRCINDNYKYRWERDYIQVKWYSLFDDIIRYKNKKIIEKKI